MMPDTAFLLHHVQQVLHGWDIVLRYRGHLEAVEVGILSLLAKRFADDLILVVVDVVEHLALGDADGDMLFIVLKHEAELFFHLVDQVMVFRLEDAG